MFKSSLSPFFFGPESINNRFKLCWRQLFQLKVTSAKMHRSSVQLNSLHCNAMSIFYCVSLTIASSAKMMNFHPLSLWLSINLSNSPTHLKLFYVKVSSFDAKVFYSAHCWVWSESLHQHSLCLESKCVLSCISSTSGLSDFLPWGQTCSG
jgi:hypothetical protein